MFCIVTQSFSQSFSHSFPSQQLHQVPTAVATAVATAGAYREATFFLTAGAAKLLSRRQLAILATREKVDDELVERALVTWQGRWGF